MSKAKPIKKITEKYPRNLNGSQESIVHEMPSNIKVETGKPRKTIKHKRSS